MRHARSAYPSCCCMTEVAAHVIKQVLNNDFVSRSSRLHQRSEARPWLPVDHKEQQWNWTEMMEFKRKSALLYVGISIVIQKELDHLLVASACAVKQCGPFSAVLQLQISTLLFGVRKNNSTRLILTLSPLWCCKMCGFELLKTCSS